MLKCKISLSPSMSYSDYILSMFDNTEPDGTLIIEAWPYDDDNDRNETFYQCSMNWTREDAEKLANEFTDILSKIEIVSEYFDKLADNDDSNKAVLGDVYDFWKKYIKQFKSADEKYNQLNQKDINEGDLTDSEKEELKKYDVFFYKDAEERIGKGVCPYDVIIRAKRSCVLMYQKAPEIIIRNEMKMFVEALVLQRYCLEYTGK